MALSVEPLESTYAPWVTRLIVTSVVLAVFTFVMGLSSGTTARPALPVAILSLGLAIAARIVAQATGAHRAGATVAIVVAAIALGSGIQTATLGNGLA